MAAPKVASSGRPGSRVDAALPLVRVPDGAEFTGVLRTDPGAGALGAGLGPFFSSLVIKWFGMETYFPVLTGLSVLLVASLVKAHSYARRQGEARNGGMQPAPTRPI